MLIKTRYLRQIPLGPKKVITNLEDGKAYGVPESAPLGLRTLLWALDRGMRRLKKVYATQHPEYWTEDRQGEIQKIKIQTIDTG